MYSLMLPNSLADCSTKHCKKYVRNIISVTQKAMEKVDGWMCTTKPKSHAQHYFEFHSKPPSWYAKDWSAVGWWCPRDDVACVS